MGMNHGMDVVSKLAKRMQLVSVSEVIIKDYLMEEWRPDLIMDYLVNMKQENLRILILSPTYQGQTDQVEPIYGTNYSVEKLQKIEGKKCKVDLPPPNQFFASNMDLIPTHIELPPREIVNNERIKLFYKADHRFQLPKGEIQIRLCYKNSSSIRDDVIKNLYLQLLKNNLREIDYMAETAYITATITFSAFGLDIHITGFNDSL